jgi:curved DNA-binding protein CbpA
MADRVAPPPRGLTHYEVLGLDQHASAGEIKHAYRVLSNRWHEAKHIGPDAAVAAQWMKLVNAAKATLYDPESKARYDDILEKTGWYDLSVEERQRHESPESLHVWRRAERQAAERARRRRETAERLRQEERAREQAEWWAARETRFWSDANPLIAQGANVEFGRMITLLQNELHHHDFLAPPEFWYQVQQALAKAVHDAQHAESQRTARNAQLAYERPPEPYVSTGTGWTETRPVDRRVTPRWQRGWDVIAVFSGTLVVAISIFAPLVPAVSHTIALNLSVLGLAGLGVYAGHRTLGLRPWRVPRHARRSAYVGLATGYLVLFSVGLLAYTKLRDGGLLGGHITTTRDELRLQLRVLSDAMVRSRNATGRWSSRIPASYQAPFSMRMRIQTDPGGGWRGEAEHWTGAVCVIAVTLTSRTTANERIACRDSPTPR